MQFYFPSFLWALGFLSIPILIHLFNLRKYKTVYFSDIRFLKEVQKTTKKQRTLKDWLILASRMMAFAALVLAFAKPYIPVGNQSKQNNKAILVLDNSISTTAGFEDVSPFEKAKQLAQNLASEFPDNLEVALITANSNAIIFTNKTELIDQIKKVQPSDNSLSFSLLEGKKSADVYLFSDLQKNNMQFLNNPSDSLQWVVVPTITDDELKLENSAIDSIWIESPFLISGQPVDLFIKLKNYGNQVADLNLEVLANNLPEINFSATVNPSKDTVIKTSLTQLKSGFNTAQINILNDAHAFDDRFLQSYFLPESNNIVEIYSQEQSTLISKIFTGNEFSFTAMPTSAIDNEQLAKADLVILNQLSEISSGLAFTLTEISNNANLFILPNPSNNQALNNFLQSVGAQEIGTIDTATLQTQSINTDDPFFNEVFAGSTKNAYWPTVKKHFRFTKPSRLPRFNLMTLANGDPLFIRIAKGQTNIFELAVPLNNVFSDISSHPVVVPLFIKALIKKDNIANHSGQVGSDSRFNIHVLNPMADKVLSMQLHEFEYIPQQQQNGEFIQIIAGKDLQRSGTYNLLFDNKKIGNVSYNIARSESNLERYSVNELTERLEQLKKENVHILEADISSISSVYSEWQMGIQLWKYFLLAALVFVLIEIFLLRLLK